MEPGIYKDISNEEYHKGPGLSASGLKLIARSPKHFREMPRKESKAMEMGTAVHCAVFEPERFEVEYVAPDRKLNRTKKEDKAEWEALVASGKTVLNKDDYDDALAMGASVRAHRLAGPLVSGGVPEQSIFWKQTVPLGDGDETKILCKCRPDYVKPMGDGYVIVDLKTTQDARSKWLRSAYWDYGYHIQAAHYHIGLTQSTGGTPPREFFFVVVESEPPYGVVVYKTPLHTLQIGIDEVSILYGIYARCKRDDKWPSYPDIIHEFTLPRGA
jgi:exodeoxyribonuclease VIII